MANVLGSLVIDVFANTGNFVAGMNKASLEARRSGREIQEAFANVGEYAEHALAPLGELGERIAGTFSQIGQAAGKAFAAFHTAGTATAAFSAVAAGAAVGAIGLGGALIAAAMHAAEVGNQIYEAQAKTHLATETLQGLMAVAKITGGNFDELAGSVAKAEANLAKGTLTGSKANKVLVDIEGGARGVAELGLKPMDDRLQIVLQRIFALTDVGQRNLALTALMKNGWQGNVEALEKYAESADHAAGLAKQLGLDMDPAKAREMKNEMNLLKAEIDGASLSLGSKLIPAIAGAVAGMTVAGPVMKSFGQELVDIGKIAVDALTKPGDASAVNDLLQQRQNITKALNEAVKKAEDDARAISTETGATNTLVDATNKHLTAIERLAKESHDFWSEFNAGLTNAGDKYPKVISLAKELMAALHPGEVQMPDQSWREIPDPDKTMKNIQELGKYDIAKGPAGGYDPFGLMAASAERAIAPIDDLNNKMQQIMQIHPGAVSPLRADFDTAFRQIAADGDDLAGHLEQSFSRFTSSVSDQLAHLIVTGRSNFRQLFRSLEEEVIKSGISKIFAQLAKSLLPGPAVSPSVPGTATSAASGAAGFIGKIFGGFLQHGGDVTPGKAYVVGERHPEFFVPNTPGEVRTSLDPGRSTPTVNNFHFHGVQDFDSFKRSQSQVMAMFQTQLASAHARNR